MGATEVLEPPETTTTGVAVVRAVYDAFARGDVPAIFALVHPEATIYQSSRLPWGGRYEGHAGIAEFLGKLTGAVASQVTTERYIDDEEGHVVAIGVTAGHALATVRRFAVPETHVRTVPDGLVTRSESYIDTGAIRGALRL